MPAGNCPNVNVEVVFFQIMCKKSTDKVNGVISLILFQE